VEHGRCEGTCDRVKVKANAEVAVHGGLIEGPRVALVELVDGLVPESSASEDSGAVCWDLEIICLRMYCRIMMYCYSRWYKYDLQLDVNHI